MGKFLSIFALCAFAVSAQANEFFGTWTGSLTYSGSADPADVNLEIATCGDNALCFSDYAGWFYLPTQVQMNGTDLVYENAVIGSMTDSSITLAYDFMLDQDLNVHYEFNMVMSGNGTAEVQDNANYGGYSSDSVSGTVTRSKGFKQNLPIASKRRGLR